MPSEKTIADVQAGRLDRIEADLLQLLELAVKAEDRLDSMGADLGRLLEMAEEAKKFLDNPVAKFMAARKRLGKLPDGTAA